MAYKFVYRHWVPAKQRVAGFPFNYKLKALKEEPEDFIEINYLVASRENEIEHQKEVIKEHIIHHFDFFKYLDEDSPDFLNSKSNLSFNIKLVRYNMVKEGNKNVKNILNTFYLQAADFTSEYSFTLVKSLDHLETILKDATRLSFDTETTGLDPEVDVIVGFSLSKEYSKGYYVPLNHNAEFSDMNLDTTKSLNLVYDAMLRVDRTYMFNARFDCRVLEYSPAKLDMLKPTVIDAQLNAHFADPEFRQHGLKDLEKHFLGYYRPDLKDTLKAYGTNSYDFSVINPKLGLFYAAQDAVSTYELGDETYKFQKEFGVAGALDQSLWPILMRFENNAMRIDTDFINEQLDIILPRLEELDNEIKSQIGDVNLNSSKQKAALLESFGLDTGVKTNTGNMATGTDAILGMIENLKEQGKDYPKWLELFDERAKLDKLNNTFFGKLAEQAEANNNRIRINYRLGITATGRLSSGKVTGFE